MLLKISQNSQENTYARASFFVNMQSWCLQLYQKRDSDTSILLWILRNFSEHFFYGTPLDDRFWSHWNCADVVVIILNRFQKYLHYLYCWIWTGFSWEIKYRINQFNLSSANPTKWSNSNNSSATADELFQCVWPFVVCGAGA